jgi:hypothetical protein
MFFQLITIFVGVGMGCLASLIAARKTIASNRSNEWPENEKSDALSRPVFHWTVVHIRDDVGMIFSLLIVTNALLAGILAALLLSLTGLKY